ncbi:MAG TPA: hypothetical protein VGX69_09695 [Solirubrobacteraceae bacterium]|jgi:hypothetical protein|nr:hypothetical protein [Solirubrobacteraceae bacterium]
MAAAPIAALLAGLLLTACGGGSSTASTTTTGTSASAASPAGTRGQFRARAAALRACLKKEGITLPERKPGQNGQRPGGPFGLDGGGLQLPKGVTRAQMRAALKKCGGGNFAGARRFGGPRNPQRLAKFAACMRQHGVNLPAPNTTRKGPLFNTSGIDTASAAFRKAETKCLRELIPAGAATGRAGAASGP